MTLVWKVPLFVLFLLSRFHESHSSYMRWNESFTTLWKDCRNPGYTKSMVVHYGMKMIWCPNAKVGTTSMYDLFRRALGTGEHLRCIKEFPKKCAPFVSMSVIPPEEQRKICERGFTTFTFVRNPYERVLSAFLDKIGRCHVNAKGKTVSQAPTYEYYCVSIRQRFKLKDTEPVTFLHFVRWLKMRRPDEFNQHWQSYRSRCATGNHRAAVHYDVVGRLEHHMNGTLNLLLPKLGLDPVLYQHSQRNSHRADKVSKLRTHYRAGTPASKEIAHTVHEIYKADIYDFGYSLGID